MVQLIRFWFGLCLLRAAPQDIPASRPVLVVSVGCYALVSMLLAGLSSGLHVGIRVALLELALLVMFTAGLLYLFNRPARIGQTLAALTGSGSLLGLPALLLVMIAASDAAAPMLSTGWLLLLVWNASTLASARKSIRRRRTTARRDQARHNIRIQKR